MYGQNFYPLVTSQRDKGLSVGRKVFVDDEEGALAEAPADRRAAPLRKNLVARAVAYAMRPHGEYPSALHELIAYAPSRWRKIFEENGIIVKATHPMPLIYSGGMLFPKKWVGLRKALANRYTASCMAYHVTCKET